METIPREDLKKKCSVCKEVKLASEFRPKQPSALKKLKDKSSPLMLVESRCRECTNKCQRDWRAKEGNKYRELQKTRFHERRARMTPAQLVKAKAHDSLKTRNNYARMKELVYGAYGGYKCACCGETEPAFLSVDHVNNDGAHYRKNVHGGGGDRMFRWLIQNNFPDGYQILCWNCQWGKVKNNGVCPHQVTRNDYPERE